MAESTLDLQNKFYNNLFVNNKSLDFVSSDFKSERFSVYQNTVFGGLISALEITYPGVWCLLENKTANSFARRFVNHANNLPQTGCLDDWGEKYSYFLRKQPELKKLKYISDYAKLEWQYFLATMAIDQAPVDHNIFMQFTEEELSAIKINFMPSFSLLKSEYNLQAIHEYITQESIDKSNNQNINQANNKLNLNINPNHSYMLVIKSNSITKIFWLKPDLWQFLFYIYNNETLGKAVDLTIQIAKNFNVVKALQFMLSNNLMSGITRGS